MKKLSNSRNRTRVMKSRAYPSPSPRGAATSPAGRSKTRSAGALSSERALHRAVSNYLRLALPADCWFSSIPGGNRGMTTTPGYCVGCPDILILSQNRLGGIHPPSVLWIELKSGRGRLSVEQRITASALCEIGCHFAECRSVEEVEETLIGFGIAPKASVRARASAGGRK